MLGTESWVLPRFEPPFEPRSRYFDAQGERLALGIKPFSEPGRLGQEARRH